MGGALLVALLLNAGTARADDAIPEEAKLYFKNGVELIQSQPPNYQDAYYQFKLAWEKSKSWKVLSNWGVCALKLERDGEAIWAYTEYLKQKEIDPDDNFAFDVTMQLTANWKQIQIPWANLKQAGWGTVKPKNMKNVLNIEFGFRQNTNFDFMLDQVEFY